MRHGFVLVALWGCGGPEEAADPVIESALVVQEPAPGAFVEGELVQVSGVAEGLTAVTVNGAPATLDGERFSASVPLVRGTNRLEVLGTQPDGDVNRALLGVLAGELAEPLGAEPYRDAALLRVNPSGLAVLMELAEDLVDPATLAAGLGTGPLYETSLLGIPITVELAEGEGALGLGDLSLVATPRADGLLQLDAVLTDFSLSLVGTATLLGFPIDGDIVIDADAEATLLLRLGVDGEGGLSVEAGVESVRFTTFQLDTSFTGPILEALAELADTLVADLLVEQADALIQPTIDELLAGLELATTLDLLGFPVTVAPSFTEAFTDADGIGLRLDLSVDLGASCPPEARRLLSPPAVPEAPLAGHAGGVIADELLNGLLLDAWCLGLLELTVDSSDPDFGSLLALLLAPLQTETGTLTLSAASPPVLVERLGGFTLQLTELTLRIDTPGRELGETVTTMMDLEADLTLSIVENAPRVVIEAARVTLVARESDWGASPEATTALVLTTLGGLLESLPSLLNVTLASLLGAPIELDLFGLSVAEATFGRDAGGSHSTLQITLGYTPPAP